MLNIILVTLIFLLLFLLLKKFKFKNNYIIKIILVIFTLEVYIFNFNSFRLKFKNYEEKYYNIFEDVLITDMLYNEETNAYIINGENPTIEITNINSEIGTVKLNAELINTNKIAYNLNYTDKTSKNYRTLPHKYLVNNIERSKYTTCYLSGESNKIEICFQGEKNTEIKINDIQINTDVPFNFSLIRVLTLSLIFILAYKMIKDKTFNTPYTKENKKQTNIIYITIMFFIFITVWVSFTTLITSSVHNEFTDAIINKRITLETQPSEELIALENPYDTTERQGIDYIWDVALYDNLYYVYFGILPFLIISIPIKLILGYHLPTNLGVLFFSIFIIINLSKIVIHIFKRWFKNTNFNYLILALIGTLSGSLIFWINRRPLLYEFVLSAGVCFSTGAIYFMLKSTEDENKINYKYLFGASSCFSLAVACRPNQLLVSLIFIPTIIKILTNNIKQRKHILKAFFSIGIPYIIIGILLMLYNYIRFESIFEFGTNYQLTVNDMGNLGYRLLTIPTGIITQLFKLPVTSNNFPFFIHQYDTISFFGYYYVEAFVCGLFILNPINFILFFLIGLGKKIKEKEIYKFTCLFAIVASIMCIANIVLAGTLQRYSMDYAWILNIASYLTLFIIVNNIKSKEIKRYILKIAIIITLFMLIANFIVGAVVSENNLLESTYPNQYYNIRYNICFWE